MSGKIKKQLMNILIEGERRGKGMGGKKKRKKIHK